MNFLKKFVASAIAVATVMTGTVCSVSATTYDNCDVNRDGYVDMADMITLNKYLYGVYSVSNYNQLDVNRSLTVDAADEECLALNVLGGTYNGGYFSRKTGTIVASPTVSGFTPNSTASSSAQREYMRYEYSTGHLLNSYNLTPTLINLNSTINSRAIIGDDDSRYPSYNPENTGIVSLSDNYGRATGFIVGDHHIATAAHCVYRKGIDVPHHWKNLTINLYDENGVITSNELTPVEAHIPAEYIDSDDSTYDYALITVEEDLSDYVQFSLGTPYNANATAYANVPIYVTGSPVDLLDENNITRLYSAEGRLMNKIETGNTDVLYYNVDTAGGDSGAPVYTITKIGSQYVYTAIAVHHGGDEDTQNWGSMVTNYHLQFYNNNPNMSYEIN